jgi:hypothetical protein
MYLFRFVVHNWEKKIFYGPLIKSHVCIKNHFSTDCLLNFHIQARQKHFGLIQSELQMPEAI